MDFAIIRTKKLPTSGNVAASAAHLLRARPTPNADPKRTGRNRYEGPATPADVLARVHELASQSEHRKPFDPADPAPRPVPRDRVLAVEYLVTASPEAFQRGGSLASDRGRQYLADALDWIKRRHRDGTVVLAAQHLDETTPHLQVIVVPLVNVAAHTRRRNVRATGGGRQIVEHPVPAQTILSARHYVGGRITLGRMQTDFAREVGQAHGLRRGVQGSQAQHTTIRAFYGAAKRAAGRIARGLTVPMPAWVDLAAAKVGIKTKKMAEIERQTADRQALGQLGLATSPQLRKQAADLNRRAASLDAREAKTQTDAQTRRYLDRQVAKLIKLAYTPQQLAEAMGVPIKGKADVFELLVKGGRAADFSAAVALVAAQCPPERGGRWEDLTVLIDAHTAATGPAVGSAPAPDSRAPGPAVDRRPPPGRARP